MTDDEAAEMRAELERLREKVVADRESRVKFEAQAELVMRRIVEDQERLTGLVVRGNGQASFTVRLDRVEGSVAQTFKQIERLYDRIDKLETAITRRRFQVWMAVIGWAVAAVATLGGALLKGDAG